MPICPLDTDFLLQETFVARIEHHTEIGSTNDRAKDLAASGPGSLPLLIVADRQTAGRGRGSNRWWTGTGSLVFTLLIDLDAWTIAPRDRPLVALAAGIAVTEAMAPLLPGVTVGIHWPNDVFAADRKLSGTLIEAPAGGLHVVGIGINTNCSLCDAPTDLRATATSLLDLTGSTHNHTALLVRLMHRFEAALGRLRASPEAIAARADELCLQRGRDIELDLGNRVVSGVCAGIGPNGALVLETPAGRRSFHSGVVRIA